MTTQIRIYVASKSRHWPFWSALRSAGIPIHASWIDAEFNHTGAEPPDWALHWLHCVEEAAAADIVLMFAREDESQMGALIEVGAALAAGKRVFLVSPHDWSWAPWFAGSRRWRMLSPRSPAWPRSSHQSGRNAAAPYEKGKTPHER